MQLEFVMEGLPRVWRSVSRLTRVTAGGKAAVVAYQHWLAFHEGLGNGGEV